MSPQEWRASACRVEPRRDDDDQRDDSTHTPKEAIERSKDTEKETDAAKEATERKPGGDTNPTPTTTHTHTNTSGGKEW